MNTYQRIVLASRPQGEVQPSNFRLETVERPVLQAGDILVRNHFLSLDPYMRGRMSAGKSYADPQPLDAPMIGGTVGEIIESKSAQFKVGEFVQAYGGWQTLSLLTPEAQTLVTRIADTTIPLSAYLGVLGMPGQTAWIGLTDILKARAGETVVVSAASGAVGSVVGQLAKLRGCRVVGIAGGAQKCRHVTETLQFDACLDYRQYPDYKRLASALAELAPKGVDAYFDNVGGLILDGVLEHMNAFGRVAVCGMISGYNGEPIPMANPLVILRSRLSITGFIVFEHRDRIPMAQAELVSHVKSQRIVTAETVAQGLEAAPEAFIGLLKGKNLGKQLVSLI
jgi:NADPH-dependent curcumin reductase